MTPTFYHQPPCAALIVGQNAQPSPAAQEGYTDSQNHKWEKQWQQGRNQNGELNTCRQKLVPKRMAIPEKSPQTNLFLPRKTAKRRIARLGSTGRWRSIVPGKTCGDVRKTDGKILQRSCFHLQSLKLEERRKWVTQHSARKPTGFLFLDRAEHVQRASAMYWLRSGSCWQRSSASKTQKFCEKVSVVSSFPSQEDVGYHRPLARRNQYSWGVATEATLAAISQMSRPSIVQDGCGSYVRSACRERVGQPTHDVIFLGDDASHEQGANVRF